MPYRWTETQDAKTLRIWPHQSLTAPGFVWFIGTTAAMLALPLLAVLGTPVLWILMAFFLAALAGVWAAISANRRRLAMHEELTLTGSEVRIDHIPARGPALHWQANPHWVRVRLTDTGPVERYLTLSGAGREVELGRCLSPEEREALYDELSRLIR